MEGMSSGSTIDNYRVCFGRAMLGVSADAVSALLNTYGDFASDDMKLPQSPGIALSRKTDHMPS